MNRRRLAVLAPLLALAAAGVAAPATAMPLPDAYDGMCPDLPSADVLEDGTVGSEVYADLYGNGGSVRVTLIQRAEERLLATVVGDRAAIVPVDVTDITAPGVLRAADLNEDGDDEIIVLIPTDHGYDGVQVWGLEGCTWVEVPLDFYGEDDPAPVPSGDAGPTDAPAPAPGRPARPTPVKVTPRFTG